MKYFVISDIHSFYKPMKKALWQAGFRKTNKEHCLIVCGDVFDRGPDSRKVFAFLMSIPKSRRIMIRGNHEDLMVEAINRGYFLRHDASNGTMNTVASIMNMEDELYDPSTYGEKFHKLVDKMIKGFKETDVYTFIKDKSNWNDWYELDNKYIFVHAFIPLKLVSGDIYDNPQLEYVPDWRVSATESMREDARWGNPAKIFDKGLFDEEAKAGKTLVCGHYHTSYMYELLKGDFSKDDCPIFYTPHFIGIDACTAYTKRANVLVIDGDDLYDQNGNKLN